jgi:hypothetical protein
MAYILSFLRRSPFRTLKVTVWMAIVLGGVCALSVPLLAQVTTPSSSDLLVNEIRSQVSTLQWIGGTIISALVATVGVLYKSLCDAHKEIKEELVSAMVKRDELLKSTIESNMKVSASMETLTHTIQERPCQMDSKSK